MDNKPAQLQLNTLEEVIKASCLSRAIAKDYYQAVAKLEGVPIEDIKARIDLLFKEEVRLMSIRFNLNLNPDPKPSQKPL